MPFDYSQVDLDGILQRAHDAMRIPQREVVRKARTRGRIILDARMGIGKTFAALTSALCYKPQTILIIGSKNSLAGWHRQIALWFPEFSDPSLYKIVRGQSWEREQAYKEPALFYVTTAGSFIRDVKWLLSKKPRFDVIIVDEPQKHGYRNRKSVTFKLTKALLMHLEKFHPPKLLFFMSGTWTSKGPRQQWAVLHLLNRKLFTSYWKWVDMFHITIKGPFGTEVGGPKNTEGLALVTAPYLYKVTEEEAAKYLPPLQRQRLTTELPQNLKNHYRTMATELYWEWESIGVQSVSTILASMTKLRQFLNCPEAVIPGLGVGPAIEACVDQMKELEELPHWRHNIIFTPFLNALPIFKDYLCEVLEMKPQQILIAKGGLEIEELHWLEEEFRQNPNTLILASLRYSQAWNAETCLNVYFPHFEWDQDENEQAEGRSRRTDGTQALINAYYVDIQDTITAAMFDTLNEKKHINNVTYQDVARIREMLRGPT